MHSVNASPNMVVWMTLAATLLSITFLVWFLAGMVMEGKRNTVRYVINSDFANRLVVRILEENLPIQEIEAGIRQHSERFKLDYIFTDARRIAPGLGSI